MIATGAAANGATNLLHAIIESDVTNNAAPIAATGFPDTTETASIVPITTRYATTGARSSGSFVLTPRSTRIATGASTTAVPTSASATSGASMPRGDEAADVADVSQEEGREPADELLARQHEEHVADERQHERGDEPSAHGFVMDAAIARVEQHRRGDEREEGARLADVFEAGVVAPARVPVAPAEQAREHDRHEGRRCHGAHRIRTVRE